MATSRENAAPRDTLNAAREWNIFAYHSFARIIARKHGIVVPEVNFDDLSDEEVERRLRLVTELAHLPPA